MKVPTHWLQKLLMISGLAMILACPSQAETADDGKLGAMLPHYVEFVSDTVEEQCRVLEKVHGVSFGPTVEDLGNAKVAKTENGVLIGVRAPLAAHEQPIIRIYFEVKNINKAVEAAEAAGAIIAYPPTKQGETGTWAIYIQNGIQHGLWQR